MSKHTPGPWNVHRSGHVVLPTNDIIAIPRTDDVDANARLIAAAPDMLEALKEAADWLSPEPLQTVRAAIAKAEGE